MLKEKRFTKEVENSEELENTEVLGFDPLKG